MSIAILYGSETGTAQDIAESLRREAQQRHLQARVHELDEYDVSQLPMEKVVLFVVSTTGQGEMPPNMRKTWKLLLRKSLGADFLKNVNIGVLGLGDSSYQKYNFAGKKLYRRLVQLGAKMMCGVHLADDQHEIGIDGAFIPWKTECWKKIKEIAENLSIYREMTAEIDTSVQITTKYRFLELGGESGNDDDDSDEDLEPQIEIPDYFPLKVLKNRRLTSAEHFQDTRLVDFEISDRNRSKMGFQPGDVLMVRPYNPEETVKIAIEALGLTEEQLKKPLKIVKNDRFSKNPPNFLVGNFSAKTTLLTCLQRYFDLQQVPKRSFFEMLGYYSTNPPEKERLQELASPEGLDDYLDYANRSRRTTAEALRDFVATSKNLKPDYLFEILTTIRPRAFSIASAPSPFHLELLVAKVEYKSRMADKRRGLCSTFISRLKPGDEVFCKIRPGTFKFPSPEAPVICIGPGTGVAPFRSLFGHRSLFSAHFPGILFFGCRSEHHDYYFSDEWPELSGVAVIPAFSRDTDGRKVYVQHKMGENAGKIKRMLDLGAQVFIAGSSGDMPKAVSAVLAQIQGDEWTRRAEETGKIQYETWS
ncbi:NADPH-dependent diflavin oxidoreductase 1 [Caenorhabditis elegans]|uniref:NADPH-dependent diflavin oxidoreductase 1 n=1 Tax=Caenorhabditis elegans TaxID=6239 RepID=M1ZMI3_CAEEL|nr:NADPH-dependent diflavin oxidoreductase 1 [Caenorhabditis elegans]CCU83307.1 NADPH-dependent diflavin oxidoreductase 1 [Caenorhabditis elegans]|eukprot:NP_001294725.1 NADPH-dependent diflavin oxidoreductase 1 [Caenorhabditis elegans]